MTHSAIASRYARALVDVTADQAVLRELQSFEEIFNRSGELRNALTSPAVPPARKRAVIGKLCEKLSISRIGRNLLFVMSDHRRIAMLPEVLEAYDLLLDERLGFTRAEVSSAQELDQAHRAEVARELERLTGKKVRMRFSVDGSLLGGLVARIGSTVYDGSVRGQLETLGKRLAAE